uniref:LRRCT domain-containing protein n=1 Tax=Branchiostoma floridae TaxID=7739 RepID=C3Z8M1_BRAFL|eukprot:XP_002595115.1 hypothetical protein BRAFLDRAFT_125784 [Branchiostoma floridae]
MSLKTLYCVSVVLCVLGSVVSVYSTAAGQSGSPSQRLKRQQIRSLSENCPYECDCNPGTLQCSQSVTRGSLTEVPDRLGSFTKARQSKTLNFEGNSITRISDDDFFGLSQAKTLNLRHNQLTVVTPDAFEGLGSLRELSLDYNKIRDLPVDIFDPLVNLRVLHLGNGRDPCDCAWAKLKARLKKGGVVIVDAVSECGEGGVRVCVDTESKNAVRKDDVPNNNKAVKLSWKSVNYGPPSEKHSSAQNPPLEKGFNGYKPKKTTPSQLKDRLLHTEGKERVSSRTDTLPWRHPGKMKAPAQDRLYSNVASETSEKHSSAQIPPLEKGFNGYKPKKTTTSQLVNIVKDMLLHTEGKESVNSRTDTLPWRNIGKMKAPAQNDAQNKNKAVKLSWKSLNYSPPSEKHSSAQNPPLEKGFKGYKPKKTTSSQLVRIVKDRLSHTEGKESVTGTDTLPWRHPGKMKSPAQDQLYSKESVSSGTDALSWWNPGKMKSSAQDQLYSKESVSSGTDTLPWWNPGKMKAPAQVASEKSPASFPWWHPDYVRTFQGFGMMKSPMSENEVEPWWHPEYDSVHQARGQHFQFVPQKHPTSTGFYKTSARQSQTYGTPSRTGHRNAYNRAKSSMESYADVVKSLYGSPHRNGNYARPNQYGRSGLQDNSRSRPAIGRPLHEYVHDKDSGTQHRKSVHSPTVSSYRTKYVHYDQDNDLYETRSRQVQNNPSQNYVDKKLQHHNHIKNILTEIKKTSNYVRPDQYGRSGLQDDSRSRPAIGRPLHEYVHDKDRGTQHRKSGHSPTVSSYRTKYVHYDPNNDLYETRSRQVQNNPRQNDVDKKLQHHNNIKNVLTEIQKSSISLGGRKMLNYMGNGRKAGRHGSRKKGEQTDEMSQREHGRRGGNEWLYDLWKRKASEKAASERETALDDSQYLMKEEEEDFKRLREKVKKLRTKIHRMEELEEERREYGEKKQVSSKSKPKESEAPPDSRARRYMVPILLPFACVVVVLVIALVVKHLSSRRQGAQKEEGDDQCDWLTKFTKKAKKKVKRPIWALGRGEKQLKINRKQAMSLAGDQEDSEDEELFDVKEEKSVPFKAYRKSRQ